jgi:enoyl-CoA hydratase
VGGGGVVLSERLGPAAVLTFNRPEKLNAISSEMLSQLGDRLDAAEADPEVRAVVLTGAGDRAFVAGADIGEYAGAEDETFRRFQERSRATFSRIDRFPKPVIAAANGYALGGGFEIVLCCDVVLAATTAVFGLPEGLLGLSPGGGGSQRLTRAAGPFVAADVLLAARRLSAQDAFRLGIVSEVVGEEDLLDAAVAKAGAVAKLAPASVQEMLGLIQVGMERRLDEGLGAEHEALFRLYRTSDAQEGIRAFVEKRDPHFTGD